MKLLTIPELAEELRKNDNYIMLTHRRPDGDTIGSAAALCGGLRALGKRAAILENPQFTEKYRPFLDGLTTDCVPENAVLVSVDVASKGIVSFSGIDYVNQVSYVIDHHGLQRDFGELGFVDPSAAACGEIILDLLRQMKAPIDKKIAEALYCAISTDTGCFRYSNVTARTLRAAADCKEYGADIFAINQVMFMTKRLARLKLDAYLTETTQFFANGLVALSVIPETLKEELGITEDDIDDISGFGREIAGVEIAIMLRQVAEGGKISVRTSPNYDASAFCAAVGGGGHKAAAGATIRGGIEEAKKQILRALEESGVKL